jgi:magnesium-transporting ATPase (P-type)
MCLTGCRDGKPADLDREGIEAQAQTLAENGLRVLAVAGGETGATRHDHPPEEEALFGLILHGLVGFIDPLRPEAVESVKICKTAGIQVLMITGDHPATAGAVAGELGLSDRDEPVVTGE